jgi:RNA polymerase sigma-70 factor (ECF subfamily)
MTGGKHDIDCLQRIGAGETSALGELYDRYIGLMFPVAVKILGSKEEAEDAMQEVWLQVWRNAASYDSARGPVAAWLITIARTRALDRYRSRSARERREDQVRAETPSSVTPANGAEAASSRDAVRRAFDRLEPHHRKVLEMAYWQGLSQNEIAERMETPLGTIKSWTRQALRDLKGALPEGELW